MIKNISLLLIILSVNISFTQSKNSTKLENLKTNILQAKTPRQKAETYSIMADALLKKDKDVAKKYNDSAYAVANKHNILDEMAIAKNIYGLLFMNSGQYDKALQSYKEAIELARSAKKESLVNSILINTANLYNKIKEYQKATDVCNKLMRKKNLSNSQTIACLNAMAITAENQKFYEFALMHYKGIVKNAKNTKNKYAEMLALNNMGLVYRKQNNYHKAIEVCEASLALSEKLEYKNVMAMTLLNVSVSYLKTAQVDKSVSYLKKSLKIAEEQNIPLIVADCHKYLSEAYAKKGDYKASYNEQVLYANLREKELGKRKEAIKVDATHTVNEKEKELNNVGRSKKNIIWVSVLTILFLVVISILLYKKKKSVQLEKQKLQEERRILNEENTSLKTKLKTLAKSKQNQNDNTNTIKPSSIHTNKQLLTPIQREKYMEKVLEYMEKEKPHLNYNLSLSKLASNLSLSTHKLSTVLKECFEKNFYDFINIYRVNEAKNLIASIENEDITMLSIAYDSGFKSKSSFNRIFKKHTQLTPSEYRENHKKEVLLQ